jgi:small subunit ribosomal protein S11
MLSREGIILIVHVFSKFNNTHVTITTLNGDVICKTSAGLIGFKGARRSTAYAAEILGLNLGK